MNRETIKGIVDFVLKISIIIGIIVFIFVYWNKDRYEYRNDYMIFDKQTGTIYSLQDRTWVKVSPFSKTEVIPYRNNK